MVPAVRESSRPFLVGAVLNGGLALLGLCVTLFVIGGSLMFSGPGLSGEVVLLGVGAFTLLIVLPVVGLVTSLQGRWPALSLMTAAVAVLGLVGAGVLTGGIDLGAASPFASEPAPLDATPAATPDAG